jgi:hypothetical protein
MSLPQERAAHKAEESYTVTFTAGQVDYILKYLSLLDNLSDDARREIAKDLTPLKAKRPECHFLDKLPAEVRNMIYSLLLVNPILGERSSILRGDDFGERTAYGLTPALLATCKQIYREASHILYEKNIFIMSFPPRYDEIFNHLNVSPVTRYGVQDCFGRSAAAISKVRVWKLIVSSCHPRVSSLPSDGFSIFCRIIYYSSPKSIELLLVPAGIIMGIART